MKHGMNTEQKNDYAMARAASSSKINLLALSGEIGFLIAIPLVALVLIGVKLDRTFATTPLFIIGGIVLASVVSTLAIRRKIKRLTNTKR